MAAETTTTISPPLPDAFLKFLNKNDIDPSIYHNSSNHSNPIPRYIRLKPQSSSGETEKALVSDIEKELKCKLEKVEWLLLCGFFSIPSHIQIAISKHYRQGNIYGIDAASGAAVIALDVSHGDHVLDLCAAPGAKLCMILDQLCGSGSLTGVDIARHRLAACRTMLQKYALGEWCRLFVADGTSFSLMPLRPQCLYSFMCSKCYFSVQKCTGEFVKEETENVFQEWASKRPWKERKRASKRNSVSALSLVPENQEPELIFYGKHSGVVGLSKSKLFGVALGSESSTTGYDKVNSSFKDSLFYSYVIS
ncbi:hypothetical protein GIB67_031706 [Kingdonia uniflora]|uniref:SAM-dependent methyltransferase RsmB-F/NOP2-type catalytic core domain-containing protein n=1 Tax=Kingdonia uniflora TaxID=39325 RepID=A0A7J7NJY4_9MAGN|nr:hypothetical protein GIB67_031706 [Kingdonia uniflora]